MFRSLTAWYDGSVLLSVVAQALLVIVVYMFLSLTLSMMPLTDVSGKSKLLSAGFHTEAHRRHRIAEGGLHL
jgi:hypothetical protein